MSDFDLPPFQPHRVLRGGHLQTIVSIGASPRNDLMPTEHVVPVSDGDAIVLHEDRPQHWERGERSVLLVHGLSGCHGAPYMLRLARRLVQQGICVYRMDMRGCGAAAMLADNITHAGRSSDLIAALDAVATLTESGPIGAIGVSMGANQLLRAVGRIGAGHDDAPPWFDRLERIAAIAPPLDLKRCSDNLQRWLLRPYNYYFIRALMDRAPPRVKQREHFQQQVQIGRPKTLRELDDRLTAPLSGFSDAVDYYSQASANTVVSYNPVRTLVLAAVDDPLVPVGCFVDDREQWPESTKLIVTPTGGHVGFIDRKRESWMDRLMEAWFAGAQV